ncbi:MAG: PAS domain S-box protein [Caldilineaceae bacterium]|nr:PAS domain S-box protein [Caldilineaceae bacterium]
MSESKRSQAEMSNDAPAPMGSTQRVRSRFPIIGVGAFSGKEETLIHFFEQIEAQSGMAFVIVHDLPPEHSTQLVKRLRSHTTMPVELVGDEARLQPNHIYIHPPDRFLSVEDGVLCVETFPTRQRHSIIDHFLSSLAEDQADFAVGLLLANIGGDGLRGLAAIKERGGLVMVESNGDASEEAPPDLLCTDLMDVTGGVDELAARLMAYAGLRAEIRLTHTDTQSDGNSDILARIIAKVREQTGHDFALYRRSMLLRRLERRMQLRAIKTIRDYLHYLQQTPAESEILFRDCLISVTQFFRDAEAFAALRQRIVPALFVGKSQEDTVRVWVPACATGEEVYSIAILLHAYAAQMEAPPQIQIFATDVNENALTIARKGWYPASVAADIPATYLPRFFTEENGGYRIAEFVRETILFASHNLLSDPPFAQLDLISCRNLLIYLQRQAQRQIFELFHYALQPGGYLFLGNASSTDMASGLFQDEEKRHSLFRSSKTDAAPRSLSPQLKSIGDAQLRAPETPPTPIDLQDRYRIWHQKRYGHPSLLVDESYNLFAIFNGAGRYLQDPDGVAATDVVQRMPISLRLDLRVALQAAFRNRQHTLSRPIPTRVQDEEFVVQMHVGPVEEPGFPQKYAEIVFIEKPIAPFTLFDVDPLGNSADPAAPLQIEDELQQTRMRLQSTVEEYESITEELTVSNEELQAMNEELRLTSEELESSKEEVQAINEELVAVNGELKNKVDALHVANSDLQNLIESTDMAILFLDKELRLQRFTPRATELFHLIASDLGRPLKHITHQVLYEEMIQDATRSLERVITVEQKVQTADGRWFIAHFSPYRTIENQIDGVVLTFVNVTALKQAEEGLIRRARQQATVADLGQYALEDADLSDLRQQVTERVAETLEIELTKIQEFTEDGQHLLLTAGVGWQEGVVGGNRVKADKSTQAGYTLYTGTPIIVDDMRHEERFSGPYLLLDHNVISGVTVVIRGPRQTYGVLGVHSTQARSFTEDDIYFLQAVANVLAQAIERHKAQQALAQINAELEDRIAERTAELVAANAQLQAEVEARQLAQDRFYKAFHISPAASAIASLADLRYLNVNASFLAMTGYSEEEIIGYRSDEIGLAAEVEQRQPALDLLNSGQGVAPLETRIRTKSGQIRYVIAAGEPIEIDGQPCLLGMMIDITERKEAEEALRQSQELLTEAEAIAEMGSWEWNIATETLHWSQGVYSIFGLRPDVSLTPDDSFLDYIHPQDRARVQLAFRQAQADPHPFEIAHRILHADGSYRSVVLRAKIILDAAGQPIKILGTTQDVTEREAIEEALRQSEARLHMAIAASGVGIYEYAVPISEEGFYSERFAELLGYTLDELPPPAERIGWLSAQIHDEDRPRLIQIYEDLLQRKIDHYDIELRLRHKDGAWIYVRALAAAHEDIGNVKRIVGVLQDITQQKEREHALQSRRQELQEMVAARTRDLEQRTAELAEEVSVRKQAEAQLLHLNENLENQVRDRTHQVRDLASALTLAEQRERQRIAGILHDHLQQLLYALLFRMQLMQESSPEDVAALLPQFRNFVEEAVATTRTLTVDLSPPILAGEGLVEALLWLCEQMREIHHLTIHVEVRQRPSQIQEELRVLLFQLVRELLFNVVKHAGVDQARLTIGMEDKTLLLTVEDDGVGFMAEQALSGQKSAAGWGLFSIRERLSLFGASFEIHSIPAQGTRAIIRFPLLEAG